MRVVCSSQGLVLTYIVALVFLVAAFLCALLFGAVPVSFEALLGEAQGITSDGSHVIVVQLRLPRALLALAIGAVLAVCGCLSQGLFRNPLADPSLIGVSAGASLGAGIAIVFLQHITGAWLAMSVVSLAAFIGSCVVVFSAYQIARSRLNGGSTSVATLLLAGIAFTFFAGSVANFLEFISDDNRLRQLSLWRMGGLDGTAFPEVMLAFGVLGVVLLVGAIHAKKLNALLLGESQARYLGVNVQALKSQLIIVIAFGVGLSVALAGTIAFVGLIVPHMSRAIVGPNHCRLIPLSGFLGAILLLAADTLSRTLMAPTELPVGLLTSFIGAPLFILLLKQQYSYSGGLR